MSDLHKEVFAHDLCLRGFVVAPLHPRDPPLLRRRESLPSYGNTVLTQGVISWSSWERTHEGKEGDGRREVGPGTLLCRSPRVGYEGESEPERSEVLTPGHLKQVIVNGADTIRFYRRVLSDFM